MGLVAPRHVGSSWIRSNPCLLHWQADSLPLSYQGKPIGAFKCGFSLSPHWNLHPRAGECWSKGSSAGSRLVSATVEVQAVCTARPVQAPAIVSLGSAAAWAPSILHPSQSVTPPRSPPHSFPLWSHTRGQAGPHVDTQHALGCELGWKGYSQSSGLLLMHSMSQHQPRHCHPTRLALGLGSLWIPNLCLLLSSSCPRSNTPWCEEWTGLEYSLDWAGTCTKEAVGNPAVTWPRPSACPRDKPVCMCSSGAESRLLTAPLLLDPVVPQPAKGALLQDWGA